MGRAGSSGTLWGRSIRGQRLMSILWAVVLYDKDYRLWAALLQNRDFGGISGAN